MKSIENKLKRAFAHFNQGRLKQAEILYLECLDKLNSEDIKLYKQALHGLGLIKIELSHYQEASQIYSKLLQISEQEGNFQEEAIAYHQLGMVQKMTGDYEQAILYLMKEQQIYEQHDPQFHLGLAANLYERGMIHLWQNKLTEAKDVLEDSLNYAKQTDDFMVIGYAYRGLGDMYQKSEDKVQAKMFYIHAAKAFQQAGDQQAVQEVEQQIEK